tara:strand:+ start:829 stop:2031 length:1203 start_codon:yes stop_codon:yes gene_type:complete
MEENENVVEETTQKETVEAVDESKFESAGDDSVIKIDLSKPINNNETQEETTEPEVDGSGTDDAGVVGSDEDTDAADKQEDVQPQAETQELEEVLEEITEESTAEVKELAEEVQEAVSEAKETGEELPENIQKLIDFMEETGGSLQDYVDLNRDYSELDNLTALTEYYKVTKPHLSVDEIDFLIEDQFNFDEEVDDEKDIKKKKIALKEQVASAKAYLDGQKSKYYDEIKAGSRLTAEQQKAWDFFNRYNEESKENQKVAENAKLKFNKKTNEVFNDKFKGFEYSVGEKKYRFNVKDAEKVKDTQSDINNFVKKFLAEDNTMSDAKGYHKSLFTAMNPDAVAKHFYEQGKADALKESVAKSKNVNMKPRQAHGEIEAGGLKVRVLGENSNDFKFKIKNKK